MFNLELVKKNSLMDFYSLKSYNNSHLLVKAEEVFGFGEYIESWISEKNYVKLYAYSNFYVEIIYDHATFSINSVKGISIDQAVQKYVSLTEFHNEMNGISFP
jgi:hypothetical protein